MGDQDTNTGGSGSGEGSGTTQTAGSGIDWQARATAAESRLGEVQTELTELRGHSRTHEDNAKKHYKALTNLHSARAIETAAKEAGFRDPSDALDLASVRDVVKFNQDWQLTEGVGDKLKEALGKVLESKPHWKAEEPKGGTAGSNAGTLQIPGMSPNSASTGHTPQFQQGGGQATQLPSTADLIKLATQRSF